jgi:WD40 repeat protein/ankyrin repeat protein
LVEEANTLQFLSDRVDEDKLFKKTLFDRVNASRKNREASIAAANAITILNKAKVNFSGMNLSGVKVSRADLSGALLDSTDLSEADLTDTVMNGAWLRDANFSRTTLTKIHFGEKPALNNHAWIYAGCYISERKILAIALDYEIELYNLTNELIATLRGHKGTIKCLKFHPELEILASLSRDQTIRLWDEKAGICLKSLEIDTSRYEHHRDMDDIAFREGYNHLIAVNLAGIIVWDLNTYDKINIIKTDTFYKPISVAYHPFNNLIVTGSDGSNKIEKDTIRIWDLNTNQTVRWLNDNSQAINLVTFNSSGILIASAEKSTHTIRIWNFHSGDCLVKLEGHKDTITSISFDKSAKRIATASEDKTVRLWDVSTGHCISVFNDPKEKIRSVNFTKEEDYLVSIGEYTCRYWEIKERTTTINFEVGPLKEITALAVTSVGGQVAVSNNDKSSDKDNTIKIWDLNNGLLLNIYHLKCSYSVVDFCSSGKLIVYSGPRSVYIHHTSNFKLLKVLGEIPSSIEDIKFHPNEKKLFIAGGKNIYCWNIEDNNCEFVFTGHTSIIKTIAIDSEGQYLASGGLDKTIKIWAIDSGHCIYSFTERNSIQHVSFHPKEPKVIGVTIGGDLRIINIKTNENHYFSLKDEPLRKANFFNCTSDYIIIQSGFDKRGEVFLWSSGQNKKVARLRFPEVIHKSVWHSSDTNPTLLVTFNNSFACFDVVALQEKISFKLRWIKRDENEFLICRGLNITGAVDLNAENAKLLYQYGAVQSDWESFFLAVKARDTAKVKELVSRNSGLISAQQQDYWTGMLITAFNGDEATAKVLLDAGANIDETLPDRYTPLIIAVQNKHLEYTRYILKRGVNRETRSKHGSALHFALENEDVPMFKLLLENGADPNIIFRGETLLHRVVKEQLLEMASALLEYGASMDIESRFNKTAYQMVQELRNKALVQLFEEFRVKKIEVNAEKVSPFPSVKAMLPQTLFGQSSSVISTQNTDKDNSLNLNKFNA